MVKGIGFNQLCLLEGQMKILINAISTVFVPALRCKFSESKIMNVDCQFLRLTLENACGILILHFLSGKWILLKLEISSIHFGEFCFDFILSNYGQYVYCILKYKDFVIVMTFP